MLEQIMMILAMVVWGANWSSTKLISTATSPLTIVFLRFVTASLLFLPLIIWKKYSLKIPKKEIGFMLGSSLIMGVYQYLFLIGVRTGLAGAGGVLVTTTNPIFTFIFAALIARKALNKHEIIGLLIGFCSLFFFLDMSHRSIQSLFSNETPIFFLASMTWAIVTILRPYITIHAIPYTFYLLCPSAILLYFYIPHETLYASLSLGKLFWGNVFYLASFGTMYSTTTFFYFAHRRGPKAAAAYNYLVPFFAMIVAVIVFKEKLNTSIILGGLLALGSVYMLQKSTRVIKNRIQE